MSDLRRWTEEGASSEEMALLSASRRERSSDRSRRRVLAAVGLGLTAVGTTATATGAAAVGAATSGATSVVAKLLIGSVVLAAVSGGAVLATRTPQRDVAAVVTPAPVETHLSWSDEPSPHAPTSLPSAEPATTGGPVDTPVPGVKRPKPAASSQLSNEVLALEAAQRALSRDPREALRELARYRTNYPRGSLAAEEGVLRVRALMLLGDVKQATTLADAFSASYPESPFAKRMQALVHGHP